MDQTALFGHRNFHLLPLLLLMGIASCTLPEGCERKAPCGVFAFEGAKNDGTESNSLPMELSFDFNPDDCGADCQCDPVCYIQMVRNYDIDAQTYIYPSTEKQERATENGWYVDRVPNRVWGYYGRNDNGTFAGYLTPGSEDTDAVLEDEPSRSEDEPWLNFWWQAVSVPVCIQDGSGCENRILGYYFWSWFVFDDGAMSDPVHQVGWVALNAEFNAAITQWNAQAVTLDKNAFPAFTEL